MVQMAADLVSGGWGAVSNIIAGIGKGAETVIGSIFPTQQRETVKSETVEAAGGTGQTFRPTAPENQSMIESNKWADWGWIGSPYEDNLSVTTKRQEGIRLAETIGPKVDPIGEGLEWALVQAKKITTLVDQLKPLWKPRGEVIKEKPRVGPPEGKDVQHQDPIKDRGAEVIEMVVGIYKQVKGLFNKGFDQIGKQPVFSIQHELEPTTKIGIGVIAAVIILILLLRKR